MKRKLKINIKNEVKIVSALLILVIFIAFSERKQGSVAVKDVVIEVENIQDNYFLDKEDVRRLMELDHENLIGASYNRLNLKSLEQRIRSDRFIDNAELYSDHKGNLVVRATLRRPIARLVRSDGPDGYIAEDGTIMPVSEKFSSRVILIGGTFANHALKIENLNDDKIGKELMAMLSIIREDDFWKAQIAQIDISIKGKVTMQPQVGDQRIEFGTFEKMEEKFRKLRVFYKEILPVKGWNRYDRINLEFEGQLIAE